ncbi:MAG: methionine--tRNA ligase subunit beta [Candidatus Omnitrophica bacterium]|nr:methionine--tRNA ligase subunit beta [Candidatus Omnitrophota bacterium]
MATYEDFKKLDFRVAEIIEAAVHPNADKLLVLKVSLGAETRQIVAGIRSSYPPETLIGKKIVVIANLDPAVIRGEQSNGMLLAASDASGHAILSPERDIETGSIVK